MADSNDFARDRVPEKGRRSPVTMGLLWITMVTGFPTVLAGFQWCKEGLTLSQVLISAAISCAIVLMYAVPAACLGAISGQTYGLLNRSIFGKIGSYITSFNFMWIFTAWYGLCALFLAEGLKGLYDIPLSVMALSALLAVVMSFNNFFGFKGVANFARYLAAPILILWVGYTFFKALSACPMSVLTEVPHHSMWTGFTAISSFIIGYAVWGNEADYWRFGKSKMFYSMIPMAIALMIGQIIFPVTGWMMSHMTGITEMDQATKLMNAYAFGNIPLVAAIVLVAAYFAVNDSNIFGLMNTIENIKPVPHRLGVAVYAIGAAGVAAFLSLSGCAKSLESIASLNSVILPTPTIIVMTEWFLLKRLWGRAPFLTQVYALDEVPLVRWPAMVALAAGITVGILTSGVVPGIAAIGICSVQSWLVAMAVYVPLRLLERKRELLDTVASMEALFNSNEPASSANALAAD